jgi:hypothetical protein
MKITTTAVKMLILAIGVVSFQSSALDVSVGARIGANISSILGDTAKGVSPKVGLTGGVFSTIRVYRNFYVQPELLLGIKGESSDTDQNISNPPNATSLTYFEIPVLLGWKFLSSGFFQASIYAGAVPALNLSAQSVYGGGAGSIDMKAKTKSFDCGLTGGLTVCIENNHSFIPIDVRYVFGLIPFNGDKNYPLNNVAISLTVGFGSEITFKREEKF